MNQSTNMTAKNSGDRQRETAREVVLRPPVEVYEDAAGITIHADLPGVSRDRLSIEVDANTLEIVGDMALAMPDGMQGLHADLRSTRFRRSFALSSDLDTGSIDANLKDGVLTLRIPKREEVKPRKVQVQVT